MSAKEEALVSLAWQTVRSKGEKDMEVFGIEDFVNFKSQDKKGNDSRYDYVTFENFAMLLNLINNVYIKNNIQPFTSQIIDEEEEESEALVRPFGYVDSCGRFMVSTQAEVDKICHRFMPLMANKRKNTQLLM